MSKQFLTAVVMLTLLVTIFCGCIETGKQSLETGKLLTWVKESGIRIKDGVSPATIIINGLYVMYYSAKGGIWAAKSTDGLVFEKIGIVVENGEPGSMQEMVSDPTIIELKNGSYRMIYEGSQKLGDREDRRLFSAFSKDGFNWTKEEGVRFQDYGDGKPGEIFTSVPDIIRLDNGSLRMYYTRGTTSATALSHDEGITWVKEKNLDLGRIVVDPDIVKLEDGSYKLFFTTFDSQFGMGEQYVMSATSSDGVSFTLDSGKRLEPSPGRILVVDPDIVKLPDGSYRMYYGEMQDDGSFNIYSAISNP